VGKAGLGPLICRLHEKNPTVKLHLVGHSFGARLVCFALAGLSPDDRGAASPVKSLAMVEGAFSHFSFCDQLPFDPNRGGGLATMQERVDGPLIALHSVHDTAVGVLYPLASSIMQQDSDEFDPQYQWGAMGHDGAQKVGAADLTLGPVGQRYPFASGAFVNLNGDDIVKAMAPISGAHSDIFHPEIAWAVLAAARVVAMP
jgi:pimeloyl-ACP methyl ester carboxylesterase